jgi:hypothetical protein
MGFIGLPVTLFLLWLMLRTRKNDPLPKGGSLVVSMHMNEILRYLGIGSGISYLFTASIAVLIILRWQKNKTLDIPVQQKVK